MPKAIFNRNARFLFNRNARFQRRAGAHRSAPSQPRHTRRVPRSCQPACQARRLPSPPPAELAQSVEPGVPSGPPGCRGRRFCQVRRTRQAHRIVQPTILASTMLASTMLASTMLASTMLAKPAESSSREPLHTRQGLPQPGAFPTRSFPSEGNPPGSEKATALFAMSLPNDGRFLANRAAGNVKKRPSLFHATDAARGRGSPRCGPGSRTGCRCSRRCAARR